MSLLSYKEITADGAAASVPSYIHAVVLTGGSDAATIIIYDNTSAAGSKIVTLKTAANTSVCFTPKEPIQARTGVYCDITGTAMAAYVYLE